MNPDFSSLVYNLYLKVHIYKNVLQGRLLQTMITEHMPCISLTIALMDVDAHP